VTITVIAVQLFVRPRRQWRSASAPELLSGRNCRARPLLHARRQPGIAGDRQSPILTAASRSYGLVKGDCATAGTCRRTDRGFSSRVRAVAHQPAMAQLPECDGLPGHGQFRVGMPAANCLHAVWHGIAEISSDCHKCACRTSAGSDSCFGQGTTNGRSPRCIRECDGGPVRSANWLRRL
jgi:hypothetical protein